MAWQLVGVSSVVEVTGTAHTLVTTGITGLQAGDLLIACFASRIASTTSITLPSAEWTLVGEQKNNNILSTSSALPSGMMACCIRGAANPSFAFTHPAAPSVAQGVLLAYRGENPAGVLDVANSITSAISVTAINVAAGVTTTQDNDLLVVLRAGGQESTISGLAAATSPTTASGATTTTGAPASDAWTERVDTVTTTGNDGALSVFDAVKSAAGATGNITATASVSSGHVVVTGAFKIATPPVTITGIAVDVACAGPFKASNGAYYFFGKDETTATTLQAYKSTAPMTSWSSIATKTGFATGINWISCFQVGNIFHLVITDGTDASANRKYQTFDASSDTFVTAETIVSGEDPRDSGSAMPRASIIVRSTAEVVVVYNSAAVSTSPRVSYKRRTGVNTWSAAVLISTGEGRNPKSVLGSSDRLHNFWTIVGVGSDTFHRHLTSANVLGTQTQPEIDTGVTEVVTWIDGASVKGVGFTSLTAWRWTSADNPTFTSAAAAFGSPTRAAVDNLVVYNLYRDSSNDIAVKSSSDDGANWSAATLSFVAGIASSEENLSRDQKVYTRAGNYVFPYICNDAGTLKYNEHIVRGGAPPDPVAYSDTVTSVNIPIAGATLADAFGFKDTITAASVPITGQAIVDRFGRTDAITAGTIPIGGASITDRYGRTEPAITVGDVPITGQNVVPSYVVGHVDYTDTITPSAVPIDGQNIVPFSTISYADAITAGDVPINGTALSDLIAFSDTVAASSVPITGQNVTPIFSAGGINYSDVVVAGTIPINGAAILPAVNLKDTVTAGSLPINGASLADVLGFKDTIAAGTIPINGSTLADVFASSDIIVAGTIPINGASIADKLAFSDSIVAGTIPITGLTIAPLYAVADTLVAGSVPITGLAIAPFFTVRYSDIIVAGSIPITGQVIVPVSTAAIHYTDTVEPGNVPIQGMEINPVWLAIGTKEAGELNFGRVVVLTKW